MSPAATPDEKRPAAAALPGNAALRQIRIAIVARRPLWRNT